MFSYKYTHCWKNFLSVEYWFSMFDNSIESYKAELYNMWVIHSAHSLFWRSVLKHIFFVRVKIWRFCHHKIHCIYADTLSAQLSYVITGNVWAKSPLNTTGIPLNRCSFCWISHKVMLTAIRLNLYCMSVSFHIIRVTA